MSTVPPSPQPREHPPAPSFADVILSIQGATSVPQAELLRGLARNAAGGVIVEIGSYRGRSTVALAKGSAEGHQAPIYAIEPHEPFTGLFGGNFGPGDRRAFYKTMLRTRSWEHVRLVNLSSEIVTPGWRQPVALLWIDGDHRYDSVKRDLEAWLPHLLPDAVVVFDDTDRGGPRRLTQELEQAGWLLVHDVGKVRAYRRPEDRTGP
jgi:predicted O-methyltransferase YrrM